MKKDEQWLDWIAFIIARVILFIGGAALAAGALFQFSMATSPYAYVVASLGGGLLAAIFVPIATQAIRQESLQETKRKSRK